MDLFNTPNFFQINNVKLQKIHQNILNKLKKNKIMQQRNPYIKF